jgi:transposase-like protein
MIDFALDGLFDESACVSWLETHLHPGGLKCPHCGNGERRIAKRNQAFVGYRCKQCDHYHTILSGTAFEKTRQKPSTLVLLLRGVSKGETTSRLSWELGICRKQMTTIRQRLQANLYDCLPENVLENETAFEADELYPFTPA